MPLLGAFVARMVVWMGCLRLAVAIAGEGERCRVRQRLLAGGRGGGQAGGAGWGWRDIAGSLPTCLSERYGQRVIEEEGAGECACDGSGSFGHGGIACA